MHGDGPSVAEEHLPPVQERWRSAGPSYSESGRISEFAARCSTTWAVQPTTRAATNRGVKARVSKPRSAYAGP